MNLISGDRIVLTSVTAHSLVRTVVALKVASATRDGKVNSVTRISTNVIHLLLLCVVPWRTVLTR